MIAVANHGQNASAVQRDTAYVYFAFKKLLASHQYYAKMNIKADRSSKRSAPDTLNRYPSLDRSACSPSRPTAHLRVNSRVGLLAIGYHPERVSVLRTGSAFGRVPYDTTMGREICRKHHSSLRQLPSSVWPGASTMTPNALSQAPVRASSHQSFWALTRLAPCSPVLPQASSVTTLASALANKLRNLAPRQGRTTSRNRRRSFASGAVFCFGDERPCSRKS